MTATDPANESGAALSGEMGIPVPASFPPTSNPTFPSATESNNTPPTVQIPGHGPIVTTDPILSFTETTQLVNNNFASTPSIMASTPNMSAQPGQAQSIGWNQGPAMSSGYANPASSAPVASAAPYGMGNYQMNPAAYPGQQMISSNALPSNSRINVLKAKLKLGKAADIFFLGVAILFTAVIFYLLSLVLISSSLIVYLFFQFLGFISLIAGSLGLGLALYNQFLSADRMKAHFQLNGKAFPDSAGIGKIGLLVSFGATCMMGLMFFILAFKLNSSYYSTLYSIASLFVAGDTHEYSNTTSISVIFLIILLAALVYFGAIITVCISYWRMLKINDAYYDDSTLLGTTATQPMAAMANTKLPVQNQMTAFPHPMPSTPYPMTAFPNSMSPNQYPLDTNQNQMGNNQNPMNSGQSYMGTGQTCPSANQNSMDTASNNLPMTSSGANPTANIPNSPVNG